ncbi:hypothetical protein A7978_05005 (plasmid) [Borrelia turicatae]|uniref:Lipoprotein n=1 Tax=Borrelia turicatae TaxID=142 RepID=A0A172XCT8_BORTU|nr:hypothetical protein [Borrelia turicatae]ANF34470.1 hypothetical protein A7978_05005 [Borrelia turicatae]UPA15550.1 hypothetical protein btBTE5EL_001235 [Borrelia turicatae]
MFKVRYFSELSILISFLLLILLVISCDLDSSEDFVTSLFGKGSVIEREYENLVQKYLKELVEEPTEGLAEESRVFTAMDIDTCVEEQFDLKLKNLLDNFGISDKGRKAVGYMYLVTTAGNSDDFLMFKQYTSDEFFNLLEQLGAERLKDMIKAFFSDLRVLSEYRLRVKEILKNIKRDSIRQKLEGELAWYEESTAYPYYLRWAFKDSNPDVVYAQVMYVGPSYVVGRIYSEAKSILKIENVYSEQHLEQPSESEWKIIDYIRDILIDEKIAQNKNYKTYTIAEFYNLLGDLDVTKIREIISRTQEILTAYEDAKVAISDINDLRLRQDFSNRLKKRVSAYGRTLKGVFNKSDINAIYRAAVKSRFIDEFALIQDEAKLISINLSSSSSKE